MDEPFIPLALPDDGALPAQDRADLAEAVRLLEGSSLPVRIAGVVGGVAGRGMGSLLARIPTALHERVLTLARTATSEALTSAYRTILPTLGRGPKLPIPARFVERASTIATGAIGGAGGLMGTALELPFTTGLLLRAIARIAAEEGEDPADDATRVECLKVLAIGAPSTGPDVDGNPLDAGGYYGARIALAEAMASVAGRAVADALPRLAAAILPRFGLSVTWKLAGQAVPVIGAASGALINLAFTQHYQEKARGHFIVRRLERTHGTDRIRGLYEQLRGTAPLHPAGA
jgi:hypothetical protein